MHLLQPGAQGRWPLYHSENGSVEHVAAVIDLLFSPDGHWLAGKIGGGAAPGLWLRPVDGDAPPAEISLPSLTNVPLAWSPDSTHLTYALEGGIGLVRVGTKEVAHAWSIGRATPLAMAWSTASSRLALQATAPDASGSLVEALFVIELP